MRIFPGTAYLWFSFLDEIQDDKLLAEYRRLLPAAERKKLERYRFDRQKKRYLIGRALIRTVLSRCTGMLAEEIIFSREPHGRPYLTPSRQEPPLQFNLSYTDGLVAAAVTVEGRVGIDVEYISRNTDCLEIAHSYFSPSEYAELQQLDDIQMKERFFELWTLKEAYLKARGLGLNLALDKVNFNFSDNNSDKITVTSSMMSDGKYWQVRLLNPSPSHKSALCVCQENDASLKLIINKSIPLVAEDEFAML